MRSFTKVTPAMWSSLLFRSLSDVERVLLLYYHTGRHQSIAGVCYVPDAYAAEDLKWSVEKCKSARNKLISKGAISFDETTAEVLVEGWWNDNGPMNEKHYKGCQAGVAAIASDDLREKAANELQKEWNQRENEKRKLAASKSPLELLTAQKAKYLSPPRDNQ